MCQKNQGFILDAKGVRNLFLPSLDDAKTPGLLSIVVTPEIIALYDPRWTSAPPVAPPAKNPASFRHQSTSPAFDRRTHQDHPLSTGPKQCWP
jgi:hypothetical protein